MRRALLIGVLLLAAAGLAFWPSLDCVPPYAIWSSPNGNAVLTVCRRPMLFAMPGQSGDAPGFAVLRTAGRIVGVVGLDMVSGVDIPPVWDGQQVSLPLNAGFTLPSERPSLGSDLWWRVRAALGFIPQSTQFR